jgi:hypothetical protein
MYMRFRYRVLGEKREQGDEKSKAIPAGPGVLLCAPHPRFLQPMIVLSYECGPVNYEQKLYCSDLMGNNVQTLYSFGIEYSNMPRYLTLENMTAIPEPMTLALLALGGLMVRRRVWSTIRRRI